MKTKALILLLCCSGIFLQFSYSKKNNIVPGSDKDIFWEIELEYVIHFNQYTGQYSADYAYGSQLDWYSFSSIKILSQSANIAELTDLLLRQAQNGVVTVYDVTGFSRGFGGYDPTRWIYMPLTKTINKEEVKSLIKKEGNSYTFTDSRSGLIINKKGIYDLSEISFKNNIFLTQEWFYNVKEKKLEVIFNDLALSHAIVDKETAAIIAYRPVLGFKYNEKSLSLNSLPKNIKDENVVWARRFQFSLGNNSSGELLLRPAVYPLGGDTSLTSPVKILLKEELPFFLLEQVLEGELSAYPDNNGNPELSKKLGEQEIKNIIIERDTQYVEDFETGELQPMVIQNVNSADALIIRQVFRYNRANNTMESEIRILAIISKIKDNMGNCTGNYKTLFWVKFQG